MNRMYFWIERNKVINNWQAEFQRGRGTEQVLRMVQDIQDGHGGWTRKDAGGNAALLEGVWQSRQDKADKRMMEEGMPCRLVRGSKLEKTSAGVPQGAVSSPSLFLLT